MKAWELQTPQPKRVGMLKDFDFNKLYLVMVSVHETYSYCWV